MQVGIVGSPQSGRTTVFRALLAHSTSPPSQAGRGGGQIGRIQVRDPRLDQLSEWFRPKKTTPIELEIHDVCTSLEPSLPRAELEALKRMDVLLIVVPQFAAQSESAALTALEHVLAELWVEDLGAIERRLARAKKEKIDATEEAALLTAQSALEAERPVRSAELSDAERRALKGYALVSERPWVVVCNQSESQAGGAPPPAVAERAAAIGAPALSLCASLEAEMAELSAPEQLDFLAEYGVREPSGAALTRTVLEQGRVIPFFTVGEDECRAWPIARGTLARGAAGQIHSDIERGFIRAEIVSYDDLAPLRGSLADARKLGKLRLESKEYVVRDGDVVHFRFNV